MLKAIIEYNATQTGEKTSEGGFSKGLFSASNQSELYIQKLSSALKIFITANRGRIRENIIL